MLKIISLSYDKFLLPIIVCAFTSYSATDSKSTFAFFFECEDKKEKNGIEVRAIQVTHIGYVPLVTLTMLHFSEPLQ